MSSLQMAFPPKGWRDYVGLSLSGSISAAPEKCERRLKVHLRKGESNKQGPKVKRGKMHLVKYKNKHFNEGASESITGNEAEKILPFKLMSFGLEAL